MTPWFVVAVSVEQTYCEIKTMIMMPSDLSDSLWDDLISGDSIFNLAYV